MRKIGCFTISSFTGIPLCTQLFEGLFSDISREPVEVYQCYIPGFVTYSDKIRNKPVIHFDTFHKFIHQSAALKIWKYLVVFFQMLIFTLRCKNILIYSIDVYSVCLGLFFKRLFVSRNLMVIYHQIEMDIPAKRSRIDRFLFRVLKKQAAKLDLFIVPEVNRLNYFRQFVPVSTNASLVFPNTTQTHFAGYEQKENVVFAHIGALGFNHYGRELITAFSNIGHEAELWLIGRTTDEMKRFIQAQQNHSIKLIESVPHSQLKEFYRQIDFGFILYRPIDLNNEYAAPNKLYEMWSYGIPVIAHQLEGLKPVFSNGCLGKLIDMQNHEMFVNTLKYCAANRSSFDRKCISNYFSEHYSLDHHINQLKEKVLGSK